MRSGRSAGHFHDRVLANAERARKLAEKAQAELDRRKQQRESA